MEQKHFRMRRLVKPEDLNPRGTLFGGQCMKWIDEEVAVYVMCQLDTKNVVTKAMSIINFMAPAKLGDIIEIGVDAIKFGKSSITVKCIVRNKDTRKEIVVIDEIVFVAVDDNGLPFAHGKTEKKEL